MSGMPLRGQERLAVQDVVSGLEEKLSAYRAAHPVSNLYLHLDKTIYTPEETLWFKAYLLGETSLEAQVLHVRLVDEERNEVSGAQFPIYDIRAHGSIELSRPSNIVHHGYLKNPLRLEGNYTLYAFTDRMAALGDTSVFVQHIRISRMTGVKLEAVASVTDTATLHAGGKVRIRIDVKEMGTRVKGIKGEYQLLVGSKELKYGRLTTNTFGEAFINFTYPDLGDDESVKVKLIFTQGNDYAELALHLPHRTNPVTINSYPEGGRLVPGGRVAIEVLDLLGNPVQTSLRVMERDSVVARVVTDSQGMATVELPRSDGLRYAVLTSDGRGQTTLDMPQSKDMEGFSLKLRQDSISSSAVIRNYGPDSTATLVLRSDGGMLWSAQHEVYPGDSLMVVVPAGRFPKDVLNLAVFDGSGVLHAERLFLNREEDDYHVLVRTKRHSYGVKERVDVTLHATDSRGQPVVTNLSLAVTEKRQTDSVVFRNILQQRYYNGFDPQFRYRLASMSQKINYNQSLLGRRWHKRHWENVLMSSPGVPASLPPAGTRGRIVSKIKRKEVHEINIRSVKPSDEVFQSLIDNKSKERVPINPYHTVPVTVNADSTFFIPASQLHSFRGAAWELDLYGNENNVINANFLVKWMDADIGYDSLIISRPWLHQEVYSPVRAESQKNASTFSFEGNNLLDEVVIGAQQVNRRRLKADCKDKICGLCNYLNCPAKPATDPIPGEIYNFSLNKMSQLNYASERRVLYLGCGRYRDINYIKNITIPEDFPLPDYEANPTSELDMRSTVYWNPNVYTDAEGMATFSFFTSDVTGEFEIVAQGLVESTLRPLMGKGRFKVVN